MVEGYIKQKDRRKILLLCDDIRMTSGISTMAREIVVGTAHKYNWVNLGAAINHPEMGKKLDISEDTNKIAKIDDSSIIIYPFNGYGNPDVIRQLLEIEKPDVIMFFTDPRYWVWLFEMENEIRQKIPMVYLNIWDDLPYPMYNKHYYESCDTLFAISKQTENINKIVLGEYAKEKVIKYIPHGINEELFFPITTDIAFDKFKADLFKNKDYKFKLFFNARNIRRKSIPDLLLAWKLFLKKINNYDDVAFVLHTQLVDENGTDLKAVSEMMFNEQESKTLIFSDNRFPTQIMNYLYNACDATILISSNEGWGLSLTESMMCGKPIIANVTGGMQDQMRFEDENGNWIKFDEKFASNHRGKYKKCGKWALPIFPNNISLIGSVPTPYIYDDRVKPEDVAEQIFNMFEIKTKNPDLYSEMCSAAREWVTSDESMMSAKNMCKNIINGIEETFKKWTPRYRFELNEIEIPKQSKHFVKYVIAE